MITFTALLRGIFELLELESRMASSDYKQFLVFLVYMGFFCPSFYRTEILEKNHREIKS